MATQPTYKLGKALIQKLNPADLVEALAKHGVDDMSIGTLRSHSECPHCGHKGQTLKDFGVRILAGEVRPQSWCRECRADPNRVKPRKARKTTKTRKTAGKGVRR